MDQQIKALEAKIEELEQNIEINYAHIKKILKYLKKKYPQDFIGTKIKNQALY